MLLTWDDSGTVRGFPYHDGYLDGVLTAQEDIHLSLRSSQKECRVLTLRRVVAVSVTDFKEGNIINTLRVVRAGELEAYPDVVATLRERLFLEPPQVADGAIVFMLEPSYGADIICVCRGAEISEPGARLSATGVGSDA